MPNLPLWPPLPRPARLGTAAQTSVARCGQVRRGSGGGYVCPVSAVWRRATAAPPPHHSDQPNTRQCHTRPTCSSVTRCPPRALCRRDLQCPPAAAEVVLEQPRRLAPPPKPGAGLPLGSSTHGAHVRLQPHARSPRVGAELPGWALLRP